MTDMVRVKVKAIGALTTQDSTLTLPPPPPPIESHDEPERATAQENNVGHQELTHDPIIT